MSRWLRVFACVLFLSPCIRAESQADGLLDQGIAFFQKQDYDAAQKYFQRVLQADPQSADAEKAKFYIAECNRLRTKPVVTTRELKLKSETTHGQILSPGQKPPPVTLEESQKQLLSGTTNVVPPAH